MNEPTDRELLELAAKAAGMVKYSPLSGDMYWKEKPPTERDATRWNARYAGRLCGTIDDKGYRRILFRFDGTVFRIRAHRLAWFIVHGKFPDDEIDHINQNKLDKTIANLRDVQRIVNQRNGTRKGNNTSGVPGVTWHKQNKKWCAQANVLGIHYHIGSYAEISDAERAVKAFRSNHGFTENHGGRAITRCAAEIGRALP